MKKRIIAALLAAMLMLLNVAAALPAAAVEPVRSEQVIESGTAASVNNGFRDPDPEPEPEASPGPTSEPVITYPTTPEGYNEHDFRALYRFFEYTDSDGMKNGKRLCEGYDSADVATWLYRDNFQWSDGDEKRLTMVVLEFGSNVDQPNPVGKLDLSNCTALTAARIGWGVQALDVSGCTSLWLLSSNGNKFSSIDVSTCTALTHFSCNESENMTEVTIPSQLTNFEFMRNGNFTSIDISALTQLNYFCSEGTPLTHIKLPSNEKYRGLTIDAGTNGSFFFYEEYDYELYMTLAKVTASPDYGYMHKEWVYGDNVQFSTERTLSLNAIYGAGLTSVTAKFREFNPYYNATEKAALSAFLEQSDDTSEHVKNGVKLCGESYSPTDPDTWNGIEWSTDTEEIFVREIHWNDKGFVGAFSISGFSKLSYLELNNNSLASVRVDNCYWLEYLKCASNGLTELTITDCPVVIHLDCGGNSFSTWTMTNKAYLQELYISSNPVITSLDLSEFTSLTYYNVGLKNSTALKTVIFPTTWRENGLTKYDSVKATGDGYIYLDNGNVVAVPNEGKGLEAWYYNITGQDDTKYTERMGFAIDAPTVACNSITAVFGDASYNAYDVTFLQNYLGTEVNGVTNGARIYGTYVPGTTDVTSLGNIGWTQNTSRKIESIHWENKGLSGELDLTGLARLEWVRVNDNHLSSINVSGLPSLAALECMNNDISSIDASSCSGLETVMANRNPLRLIKLPNNGHFRFTEVRSAGHGTFEYFNYYDIYNPLPEITAESEFLYGFVGWYDGDAFSYDPETFGSRYPDENDTGEAAHILGSAIDPENWKKLSVPNVDPSITKLVAFFVPGHNDPDENAQLRAFLELHNDFTDTSNGAGAMGASYDPDNHLTWKGLTWTNEVVRHVTKIVWAHGYVDGEFEDVPLEALCGDLDISGFDLLELADFWGSKSITSIDASNCPELKTLTCAYLQTLTNLDAHGCSKLAGLNFAGNAITAGHIDLTGCTSLSTLEGSYNPLGTIDVSTLHNLKELIIKAIGTTYVGSQAYADAHGWGNDTTNVIIDNTNNPLLMKLDCSENNLKGLDVHLLSNLSELNCSDCTLDTIDVSQNAALTSLNCANNRLTVIDTSHNPELTNLDCSGNQLEQIDTQSNEHLVNLYCSDNLIWRILTYIDYTILRVLEFSNNQMQSFNFGCYSNLGWIGCSGNLFTEVVLTNDNCWFNTIGRTSGSGRGCVGISTRTIRLPHTRGSEDEEEEITCYYAVATPEEGCAFIGWYDGDGNLISTDLELDYRLTNGNRNVYAKFAETPAVTGERIEIRSGTSTDTKKDLRFMFKVTLNDSCVHFGGHSYGTEGYYGIYGLSVDLNVEGSSAHQSVMCNNIYYMYQNGETPHFIFNVVVNGITYYSDENNQFALVINAVPSVAYLLDNKIYYVDGTSAKLSGSVESVLNTNG